MISQATQRPAFVIAFPVIDQGQKVGLAGFTVSLDKLIEITKDFTPLGLGYVVLTDSTGTIVTHPNADYIMKLKLSEADSQGFKGLSALEANILSGKEGMGDISDPNGKQLKVFYSPLNYASGWSAMVIIPSSVISSIASKRNSRYHNHNCSFSACQFNYVFCHLKDNKTLGCNNGFRRKIWSGISGR